MRLFPKLLVLVFISLSFVLHTLVGHTAAVNPDIYSLPDLEKNIRQIEKDYNVLNKEQSARKTELAKIKSELPKYQGLQTQGGRKERKAAAEKVAEMERRKDVLQQKMAYYEPKLTDLKNRHAIFTKVYKVRAAEWAQMPKGAPSSWKMPQAQKAAQLYKKEVDRARLRLNYYKKLYSESAADMQESARQQNYVSQLGGELQAAEKKYFQYESFVQNMSYQTEYTRHAETAGAAEDDNADAKISRVTTPQTRTVKVIVNAPPVAVTTQSAPEPLNANTTQVSAPPIVVAPKVPVAEAPADLITTFDQFIENSRWAIVMAFFFAASLSLFLGMQLTDSDNQRHRVLSAGLFGAIIAALFTIPFFGAVLGFLCFILAFPFYYKLSMDTLVKTLPLSLGLFLVSGVTFLGLTWLVLH